MITRKRSWTTNELIEATRASTSFRQVLKRLGLAEAGGNYDTIKKTVIKSSIPTDHFTGRGWRKGRSFSFKPRRKLVDILTKNSDYQSHKLKKRLFREGLLNEVCCLCGWHKTSPDGRIPLELDHINGDKHDNRLSNLRILCPNCHSLQLTHRGRNKGRKSGW